MMAISRRFCKKGEGRQISDADLRYCRCKYMEKVRIGGKETGMIE